MPHIYIFTPSLIMILSFHVDTVALVNLSSSCPPRTDIPSLLVSAATALIAVLRFLQSKQTIYSFIYKKRGKIGVVFFVFFYMHYVPFLLPNWQDLYCIVTYLHCPYFQSRSRARRILSSSSPALPRLSPLPIAFTYICKILAKPCPVSCNLPRTKPSQVLISPFSLRNPCVLAWLVARCRPSLQRRSSGASR